jgi:hypothetical protein
METHGQQHRTRLKPNKTELKTPTETKTDAKTTA